VGSIVEVYLERIENALGDAVLSRDKAKRDKPGRASSACTRRKNPSKARSSAA
jgi:ribosomal protein S1